MLKLKQAVSCEGNMKRLAEFSNISTLTSVQVAVLLFLETWLTNVPEDFMQSITTVHGSGVSAPRCDILDELIDFLWAMSQDNSLIAFGLQRQLETDDYQLPQQYQVTVAQFSLLSERFPCLSKLVVLISEKYLKSDTETHENVIEDTNENRDSRYPSSDNEVDHDGLGGLESNSVEEVLHFSLERPLSLKPKDIENDREFYKQQVERVMSGEIKDRESLTSLRMSFFDMFGDDSLSEILEFESEILSQHQEGGDHRQASWKVSPSQPNLYQYSTSASVINAGLSSNKNPTGEDVGATENVQVHDSVGISIETTSSNTGSFDALKFFKSLFKSSKQNLGSDGASNMSMKIGNRDDIVDSCTASIDQGHAPGSHAIMLPASGNGPHTSANITRILVPQNEIPSALTAASIGIRMQTQMRRDSSSGYPINQPNLMDRSKVSMLELNNTNNAKKKFSMPMRSQVVKMLSENSDSRFTPCVELYSYFGLILSAVELRAAQDYVSDMTHCEVPSRLFVDPIDRYIVKYNSTDAACSEKISYLVKSSREDNLLSPIETVRLVTPPSVDKERTSVSPDHKSAEETSQYVYDADYNNSSSINVQQKLRNKHKKEQRRQTMGSLFRRNQPKDVTRRRTLFSPETSGRMTGRSWRSLAEKNNVKRSSITEPGSRNDLSFSMSSRQTFSVSEVLFGSSQVYQGPSIFLGNDVYKVAANLTMRLHYMFCTIPILEFVVDYVYSYDTKTKCRSKTPMLTRFRQESEKLQLIFIGEVLVHPDVSTRAEVIIKMITVAEFLAKMRSHHALMLIVYALHSHAIYRLKSTWAVVHAKLPGRWELLTELVGMGGKKLVAFFCQRQPKNGISSDIREKIYIDLDKEHSILGEQDKSSELISSSPFGFQKENGAIRLSSPTTLPRTYSSDSDSSYEGSDKRYSCKRRSTSEDFSSGMINYKENNADDYYTPTSKLSYGSAHEEVVGEISLKSVLQFCDIPISMKFVDLDTIDLHSRSRTCFRLGFRFMKSGQGQLYQMLLPGESQKITATESSASIASQSDSINKDEKSSNEKTAVNMDNKPASCVRWHVESCSTYSHQDLESDEETEKSDDDNSSSDILKHTEDTLEDICQCSTSENTDVTTMPSISAPNEYFEDSNSRVQSTQTVNMLVALTEGSRDKNISYPSHQDDKNRRRSYRHMQVHTLSLNPPQSGLGEVRSDGLTSSNAFSGTYFSGARCLYSVSLIHCSGRLCCTSGIPIASHKPFMPFLNGILQKIIRLNELPNFLRSQSSTTSSTPPKNDNEHGYLWVESPGNSSTDPKLMMINFGKFRSISNLLMVIRSSQLTPFRLHVDFGEFLAWSQEEHSPKFLFLAVQALFYREAIYKNEDEIWDRSSELE